MYAFTEDATLYISFGHTDGAVDEARCMRTHRRSADEAGEHMLMRSAARVLLWLFRCLTM